MSVPFDFEPGFPEILVEWNSGAGKGVAKGHSAIKRLSMREKLRWDRCDDGCVFL